MLGNLAGFFSQTAQRDSRIIWQLRQKKAGLELLQASQLQLCVLVAVVTLVILVISVTAIVRPSIIRAVIWITPVIAIIASRIIAISWISVVAVPVRGVTESNSNRADSNRNLSISLFHRNQSESDRYQWK